MEYKSRDFCKSVGCRIQKVHEAQEASGDLAHFDRPAKSFCKESCLKTAWEFHDWLQQNSYKIIKDREKMN